MGKEQIQVYNQIGKKRNNYDTTEYTSGSEFASSLTAALNTDADEVDIHIAGLGGSDFMCLSCDKISASKNAWIMTHSIQGQAQGSPADMRAEADLLDKMNSTWAELLAERTGLSVEDVTAKFLNAETWFTAQEALEAKLIDEILDYEAENVPEITASLSYQDAVERFTALKTGKAAIKAKPSFIAELTAFLTSRLNLTGKSAIKLTDNEESWIQSMIYYLQSIVDYCETIIDNSSNQELLAYAKDQMDTGSKAIIMLVTMLYGEEESDAATARVKDIVTKQAAKSKTAQLDSKDVIKAAAEFMQPKLDEKDAEIKRLTAQVNALEAKPVAKPTKVAADKKANVTPEDDEDRVLSDVERKVAQLKELDNFSWTDSRI